jgi:hypothetical protein
MIGRDEAVRRERVRQQKMVEAYVPSYNPATALLYKSEIASLESRVAEKRSYMMRQGYSAAEVEAGLADEYRHLREMLQRQTEAESGVTQTSLNVERMLFANQRVPVEAMGEIEMRRGPVAAAAAVPPIPIEGMAAPHPDPTRSLAQAALRRAMVPVSSPAATSLALSGSSMAVGGQRSRAGLVVSHGANAAINPAAAASAAASTSVTVEATPGAPPGAAPGPAAAGELASPSASARPVPRTPTSPPGMRDIGEEEGSGTVTGAGGSPASGAPAVATGPVSPAQLALSDAESAADDSTRGGAAGGAGAGAGAGSNPFGSPVGPQPTDTAYFKAARRAFDPPPTNDEEIKEAFRKAVSAYSRSRGGSTNPLEVPSTSHDIAAFLIRRRRMYAADLPTIVQEQFNTMVQQYNAVTPNASSSAEAPSAAAPPGTPPTAEATAASERRGALAERADAVGVGPRQRFQGVRDTIIAAREQTRDASTGGS